MWDMSAPENMSERHVLRRLVPSEPLALGPLDDVGNVSGVLMLPCPDDQPPVLAEAFLRATVPREVASSLDHHHSAFAFGATA